MATAIAPRSTAISATPTTRTSNIPRRWMRSARRWRSIPTIFDRKGGRRVAAPAAHRARSRLFYFLLAKSYAKTGDAEHTAHYLKLARDDGYKEFRAAEKDPEFAAVIKDPRVQEVLQVTPSYVDDAQESRSRISIFGSARSNRSRDRFAASIDYLAIIPAQDDFPVIAMLVVCAVCLSRGSVASRCAGRARALLPLRRPPLSISIFERCRAAHRRRNRADPRRIHRRRNRTGEPRSRQPDSDHDQHARAASTRPCARSSRRS